MSKLTYVQGDATAPVRQTEGTIIYGPHCCNDEGGWGSGYVLALNKRFGEGPRGIYKMWHKGANTEQINERLKERDNAADPKLIHQTRFVLGGIQLLGFPNDYVLVNMIGQHKTIATAADRPPIRYGAIAKAMHGLADFIRGDGRPSEIHCPKFGSELAGGDWKVIESLIRELWVDNGIPVVVYEWVK